MTTVFDPETRLTHRDTGIAVSAYDLCRIIAEAERAAAYHRRTEIELRASAETVRGWSDDDADESSREEMVAFSEAEADLHMRRGNLCAARAACLRTTYGVAGEIDLAAFPAYD